MDDELIDVPLDVEAERYVKKHASVGPVLERLNVSGHGWQLVDDWDADLCAIGVCRVGDENRLVYISTWPPEAAGYHYDCEVRLGPQETDYNSVQSGDTGDLEEVVSVVAAHLGES